MTAAIPSARSSAWSLQHLSAQELFVGLERLVRQDREVTAALLAHLAEVDERRLYREAACPSLFAYCTERLHLSEPAAYKRVHAARTARAFPVIFDMVARGELHIAAVILLAPYLTAGNHRDLLAAATHRSKRAVEQLLAVRYPRLAVPDSVRRLPACPRAGMALGTEATGPGAALGTEATGSGQDAILSPTMPAAKPVTGLPAAAPAPASAPARPDASPRAAARPDAPRPGPTAVEATVPGAAPQPATLGAGPASTGPPAASAPVPAPVPASTAAACLTPGPVRAGAVLVPLSADRYRVQFTATRHVRDRLREAQDLMRREVPDGDLNTVIGAALDLLVRELMRKKFATTDRPRATAASGEGSRTRRVPAAIRRQVGVRDGYQCTFVDAEGRRCPERGGLEFHHCDPLGRGGEHRVDRITLRCQAHHALATEREWGAAHVAAAITARRAQARRAPAEGAGTTPAGAAPEPRPPPARRPRMGASGA
ncbi:MAG TPA: hypothetical protein VGQ83_02215 [Polyangia bacterium]|jgi:hypothetical protein